MFCPSTSLLKGERILCEEGSVIGARGKVEVASDTRLIAGMDFVNCSKLVLNAEDVKASARLNQDAALSIACTVAGEARSGDWVLKAEYGDVVVGDITADFGVEVNCRRGQMTNLSSSSVVALLEGSVNVVQALVRPENEKLVCSEALCSYWRNRIDKVYFTFILNIGKDRLCMHSPRALKFERLYSVAERQQGFFAALQAREQGYSRQLQSYHVGAGDWIKKGRGIFRLKYFPPAPWPDGFYMTYLWSLNRDGEPEGVFGYGTALYLHNLSTYVPPVFDVIVPKHFRRHSEPPGATQIYKQTIDRDQVQIIAGLPVTRPLKTIIDLLDTKAIDYDYVLDALRTALERFAITDKQMRSAKLTAAQKGRLMAALKRIKHEFIDEIR